MARYDKLIKLLTNCILSWQHWPLKEQLEPEYKMGDAPLNCATCTAASCWTGVDISWFHEHSFELTALIKLPCHKNPGKTYFVRMPMTTYTPSINTWFSDPVMLWTQSDRIVIRTRQTTFRGGLGHICPYSFSSVNAKASWDLLLSWPGLLVSCVFFGTKPKVICGVIFVHSGLHP